MATVFTLRSAPRLDLPRRVPGPQSQKPSKPQKYSSRAEKWEILGNVGSSWSSCFCSDLKENTENAEWRMVPVLGATFVVALVVSHPKRLGW